MEVIESVNSPAPQISDAKRGAHLFVAKGCGTCHVNSRIDSDNVHSLFPQPDLSNYNASAEFLKLWLKDPKSVRPGTTMPDPHLGDEEINALTTFLLYRISAE